MRVRSAPLIALGAGLLLLLAGPGQGRARAEDLASPRLNTLRQEIATGGPAALERFWRQLSEQGTPLIEPVEGKEDLLAAGRIPPLVAVFVANPNAEARVRERGCQALLAARGFAGGESLCTLPLLLLPWYYVAWHSHNPS